jgi:hypothetical protein
MHPSAVIAPVAGGGGPGKSNGGALAQAKSAFLSYTWCNH